MSTLWLKVLVVLIVVCLLGSAGLRCVWLKVGPQSGETFPRMSLNSETRESKVAIVQVVERKTVVDRRGHYLHGGLALLEICAALLLLIAKGRRITAGCIAIANGIAALLSIARPSAVHCALGAVGLIGGNAAASAISATIVTVVAWAVHFARRM